jgi:putative flippase GtrA
VALTRLIPARYRSLVRELLTFGTVGGINTLLGMVIFNLVLSLGALTANTISTAIATMCSFVLNRHVTYRDRPKTSLRRELPLFVALNMVGLGIQLGILDAAKNLFGLQDSDRLELNIARFAAVLVGTVFLLLTYRTFVFKPKTPAVTPAALDAVPAQARPDGDAIGPEAVDPEITALDELDGETSDEPLAERPMTAEMRPAATPPVTATL